jgi:hypothetical protein
MPHSSKEKRRDILTKVLVQARPLAVSPEALDPFRLFQATCHNILQAQSFAACLVAVQPMETAQDMVNTCVDLESGRARAWQPRWPP